MEAFDFSRFYPSLEKCFYQYQDAVVGEVAWTLKDYEMFFRHFFHTHEQYTGTPHFPIAFTYILDYLGRLPEITVMLDGKAVVVEMRPEDYFQIVDLYYKTNYANNWTWCLPSFMGVCPSLWKRINRARCNGQDKPQQAEECKNRGCDAECRNGPI